MIEINKKKLLDNLFFTYSQDMLKIFWQVNCLKHTLQQMISCSYKIKKLSHSIEGESRYVKDWFY